MKFQLKSNEIFEIRRISTKEWWPNWCDVHSKRNRGRTEFRKASTSFSHCHPHGFGRIRRDWPSKGQQPTSNRRQPTKTPTSPSKRRFQVFFGGKSSSSLANGRTSTGKWDEMPWKRIRNRRISANKWICRCRQCPGWKTILERSSKSTWRTRGNRFCGRFSRNASRTQRNRMKMPKPTRSWHKLYNQTPTDCPDCSEDCELGNLQTAPLGNGKRSIAIESTNSAERWRLIVSFRFGVWWATTATRWASGRSSNCASAK